MRGTRRSLLGENEVDLELMARCGPKAGMTQLPSIGNKSNRAVDNGIAKEEEGEAVGECDILDI